MAGVEHERGQRGQRQAGDQPEVGTIVRSELSQAHLTGSLTRLLQPAGLWRLKGQREGLGEWENLQRERWQSQRQKVLKTRDQHGVSEAVRFWMCPDNKTAHANRENS